MIETCAREITLDVDGVEVTFECRYEYEPGCPDGWRTPGVARQVILRGASLWRPNAHGGGGNSIPLREDGWALLEALGLVERLEQEILSEREGER